MENVGGKFWVGKGLRTADTQWRHKSKKSEILGRCARQNMLWPYLKIWDWDLILAVQWRGFPHRVSVVGRIISELDQWKKNTKQIFSKLCVEKWRSQILSQKRSLRAFGRGTNYQWTRSVKQIFSKLSENEGARVLNRKGQWYLTIWALEPKGAWTRGRVV